MVTAVDLVSTRPQVADRLLADPTLPAGVPLAYDRGEADTGSRFTTGR